MKKKRKPAESEPSGEPEILLDRVIAVRAPANLAKLAANVPLHPEIQRFLNDAFAAANAAHESVPRRARTRQNKKVPARPPARRKRS